MDVATALITREWLSAESWELNQEQRYYLMASKKKENRVECPEGAKLIPLDTLLDNLHFKLDVEIITSMHSTSHLNTLISTVYYLEQLKEIKDNVR